MAPMNSDEYQLISNADDDCEVNTRPIQVSFAVARPKAASCIFPIAY